MKSRSLLRLVVIVFAVLGSVQHARAADAPAKRRPNIVLFLADDLGWRDLGYAGSTFYESPNIDALARRGVVFDRAYAPCPVCSPSRAALMTGRYPARVGVTDYIGGPQPNQAATRPLYRDRLLPAPYQAQLALRETTIAEALREAGYATLCAGKWHLGGPKFSPEHQGFDEALIVSGAERKIGPSASTGPAGEHHSLRLARESAEWVAEQSAAGKPFFLYFPTHDPHIPLRPPAVDVAYFEAKRARLGLTDEFKPDGEYEVRQTQAHAVYAATIKTLDDTVGVVIKQLEALNLLQDTIIIFASDNGGLSTREGSPTSNAPLRAGKGWPYEGGVRIPMLAIVPGVTRAGATCSERVVLNDLFPTLLDACALPLRPNEHLDGVSLVPALRGEKLAPRDLFWHYPHYGNQGGRPYSAVRSGDWKLIAFHDPRLGTELYNLADDPHEKKSLAAEQGERVASLRQTLDAWKKDVGAVDAAPAAR